MDLIHGYTPRNQVAIEQSIDEPIHGLSSQTYKSCPFIHTYTPQPSMTACGDEEQIEEDLQQLNSQGMTALAQLYADIGGQQNLSSYRTSDGSSLLDLTAYANLPQAAHILLNAGYQFRSVSQDGTILNDVPPRYQWDENGGYCGEESLSSAAAAYGTYIDQYNMRALIGTQNKDQLLLGKKDRIAAEKLRLNATTWEGTGKSTDDFLIWVKQNVSQGHPVAIGVYINESIFGEKGDREYDHIITITGVKAQNPSVTDYNGKDLLYYSDNGFYGDDTANTQYAYRVSFHKFQGSRRQANQKKAPIYTLPNATNYGIAITGIQDADRQTLPVHILLNVKDEPSEITDGSNQRPIPTTVTLLVVVTNLKPGITYNLYEYTSLESVPTASFNAMARRAAKCTQITVHSGSSYVFTQTVSSSDILTYRVVPITAP